MKQPIQILLLPTNQKATIFTDRYGNLKLHDIPSTLPIDSIGSNQHLYLLSDEQPKKGEWSIYIPTMKLHKCIEDIIDDEFKKVIATTDESLIEESRLMRECFPLKIHKPSQEFIQYYVEQYNKGNIIEWVDVEYDLAINDIHCDKWELKVTPDNTINISPIKDLDYWKTNAEEDYIKVPISVLRYISELEKSIKDSWSRDEVVELLKAFEHHTNLVKEYKLGNSLDLDDWISENLK